MITPTCLAAYGIRFHSIEDAILFTAVIILTFAGILLYPYAKKEFLKSKINETNKVLLVKSRQKEYWKKIPSKDHIENQYPQILTAMSVKSTESIKEDISVEYMKYLNGRFEKWNKQKIDYSFVWMEIEVVENIKIKENSRGEFIYIYVAGKNVDYMKEKGRHSAMGNQTRKKKDFQDILVYKYWNNKWVIHSTIKDVWFWQM